MTTETAICPACEAGDHGTAELMTALFACGCACHRSSVIAPAGIRAEFNPNLSGMADALRDAMTKQLRHGTRQARTVSGPLFDQQPGLF